jgi:hypothetical protein
MQTTEIKVGYSLLPTDERERRQRLHEYFCELSATATRIPEGWSVSLAWPGSPEYYVDPRLAEGLDWWSEDFGEVDVRSIPYALHREPGFQLSLNDSWTIYSWSRWLSGLTVPEALPPRVTLLHLDDHDDFMKPRIFSHGKGWRDGISGLTFDLWQPEGVESSIKSGAIGIGSFMAPFLHSLPEVHIRHLCATEYSSQRKGPYQVQAVSEEDDLLDSGAFRPALKLQPDHSSGDDANQIKSHPYIVTDDTSQWLNDLPDGPILLHIDMDYFNNRFNGDSDRVNGEAKYDPPLPSVLSRIDEVFDSLAGEGVVERLVDVAVALSPGFFPADLWAPSIGRIRDHIKRCKDAVRYMIGK